MFQTFKPPPRKPTHQKKHQSSIHLFTDFFTPFQVPTCIRCWRSFSRFATSDVSFRDGDFVVWIFEKTAWWFRLTATFSNFCLKNQQLSAEMFFLMGDMYSHTCGSLACLLLRYFCTWHVFVLADCLQSCEFHILHSMHGGPGIDRVGAPRGVDINVELARLQ